jgi:hypothetical protein
MIIDAMHRKSHFADGDRGSRATVPCLIAWQHEDIALTTKTGDPGISAEILTQTKQQGRSMCQRVGRFANWRALRSGVRFRSAKWPRADDRLHARSPTIADGRPS